MQQRPWKIKPHRLKPIGQPYGRYQPGRPPGRSLDAQTKGAPAYMPNRADVTRATQRSARRLKRS